uniref:G_PROTEIN_RECEP_F1_2 domain-containing protein n=1 Tax=Meloidogyne hapla TaxID=6305 RepID=A0A1I8B5Q0_MELHA
MSENNSSPSPDMDLTTGTLYTYTLILTLMQQFYCSIGFIFDASVTYVTFKNKSLHKSYGYLLGICSFFNALMDTTNFLPTFLVLTKTQISMKNCFWLQAYGSVLDTNAPFCLLFISFDRLLSFVRPIL